jgi:hypothetical protein
MEKRKAGADLVARAVHPHPFILIDGSNYNVTGFTLWRGAHDNSTALSLRHAKIFIYVRTRSPRTPCALF